KHHALTLVDAVSGLGGSEFQMDAWNFDVVVTASQKVLATPPGVAMVAMSERALRAMEAAAIPHYYFSLRKALDFAKQGQTSWTPPVSVLFALDVALDGYHREGAA